VLFSIVSAGMRAQGARFTSVPGATQAIISCGRGRQEKKGTLCVRKGKKGKREKEKFFLSTRAFQQAHLWSRAPTFSFFPFGMLGMSGNVGNAGV
jgi:hypothetical protein